jgi:hypothetical protein
MAVCADPARSLITDTSFQESKFDLFAAIGERRSLRDSSALSNG